MAQVQNLQAIREKIINDLSGMSDEVLGNDDVDIPALIALAHATGKEEFLQKALEKANSIKDSDVRTNALLDLLDEVELLIAEERNQNSEAPAAATENP